MVQVRVAHRQLGFIPEPPDEEMRRRQNPTFPGWHLIREMSIGSFGAKTRELRTWCGISMRMYVVADDGLQVICERCLERRG